MTGPYMNYEEERQETTVESENGHLSGEPVLGEEQAASAEESEEAGGEDGDAPGEESPEETIVRLESELARARDEATGAVDTMQRTVAEYENAGKRRERQNEERIMRATENMMRQLLPVLDDLERAFEHVPARVRGEDRAWLQGFEQIQQKLQDILANANVESLPLTGEFDPTVHEAISNEPDADVPSGHIIQTLRTGYRIQERVLRPALVRVAQ